MPPRLALLLYSLFILWLFVRDFKRSEKVSSALWIPLLWMLILGSRPMTLWLSLGMQLDSSVDYSEGSPVDRFGFLCLIIAGLAVLSRRNFRLAELVRGNRCLCLFYIFWAVSIAWSPEPFVALKRWIKEAGNVVMVLVVLTDPNPVAAVKAVFARMAYVLIPLSVLFIKYFPDLGRVYNHWTWLPSVTGVTTDKNALGELVLVCGVAMVWDALDTRLAGRKLYSRWDILGKVLLALMTAWLMSKANSATSLVCIILGTLILFALRLEWLKRDVRHIEIYALMLVAALALFNWLLPLGEIFTHEIGRNMTLTDRTEIWKLALAVDENPILGTGFYSFWMTRASDKITDVFVGINQAHNGYLETYLNGGMVAVALLAITLLAGYRGIKRALILASRLAPLRLVLFITGLIHNITEASFNRVAIIWFVLLLAMIDVPSAEIQLHDADQPGAEDFEDNPESVATHPPELAPGHAG